MNPLTMTIDIKVLDGDDVLAREVLQLGADNTRELLRRIDGVVANTALTVLIEARERQLDAAPPVAL